MLLQQQIINKFWESTSDSKEDDGTTTSTTKRKNDEQVFIPNLVYLKYLFHYKAGGLMIKHVASVHISSHCCYYKALHHWTTHKDIQAYSTHPVHIPFTPWWLKATCRTKKNTRCQFSHHQLPLTTTQTGRTGNTLLYQRALTQSQKHDYAQRASWNNAPDIFKRVVIKIKCI